MGEGGKGKGEGGKGKGERRKAKGERRKGCSLTFLKGSVASYPGSSGRIAETVGENGGWSENSREISINLTAMQNSGKGCRLAIKE
jgi:hypothetical protein